MADRYWVTGGNGNTNSTTNWSDTSGGAAGFSVPILGDNVFFDGSSGAGTVTVNAALVCTTLDCTGFTGTIAGSSALTVAGNLTLDAGMTLSYTGTLTISTTSTITSNAVIWSGNIGIGAAASTFTVTLADDLYITGTFATVSTVQLTMNGNNLYVAGNFSVPAGSTLVGTTGVILNTTTSQTLTTRTDIVNLRLDLTFNASGTIILANNIRLGTGISTNKTITYIAGTMSMPANINIQVDAGRTINLDTSGMTWSTITVLSNGVFNLVSDLYLSGTLVTSTNSWSGSFTIYVGGDLTLTGTAAAAASTTSIEMNGTGTISGAGGLRLNLIINTAGTITFSGTITYSTGTLTYTAGTVNTGTSTIQLNGSMTLSATLASITFYNLVFFATVGNDTFTLNSHLYVTNNIVITGSAANPKTSGIYNLYTGGLTLTSGSFRTTEVSTSCATLIFNGTGTWSQASSSLDVQLNVTINTSGVLTLGTSIRTFTARFTYITGTVITTGNTWYFTSGELDTNVLAWNNVQSDSNGTTTLISDLNIAGNYTVATFTATINGLFNINIGGNLSCTSSGTLTGSATTKLVGTGVVTVGSSTIRTNLIIDTSGTITFSGTVSYRGGTFTYRRGKVIAGTATLYIALSCTLIDIHKIVFGYVTILGGQLINMNQFFSGSANIRTRIASTNTTNYIITFQDGFEKVSKFVKLSNATITNRGQLLVITDKANANTAGAVNLGVRYTNTVPNGISKSNPSANLQACFGIDDGFCAEPLSK